MESILKLQNVTLKKGDKTIINDLSLEIWKGHIHAIIGPNGAGKSTFAYLVMGLDGYTKFDGDILFEDVSIKKDKVHERAKKGITLAWQEPARFEGITVKQYLEASQNEHVNENNTIAALNKVGLSPIKYLYRAVDKTLSGGERKRIELASIYLMKPKLVIMDEPDSGIDIEAINYIFDILNDLKKQGTTVVMVTHNMEVLKRADHGFLICNGTLHNKGSIDEVQNFFLKKCTSCREELEPQIIRGEDDE